MKIKNNTCDSCNRVLAPTENLCGECLSHKFDEKLNEKEPVTSKVFMSIPNACVMCSNDAEIHIEFLHGPDISVCDSCARKLIKEIWQCCGQVKKIEASMTS